MTNFVETVMFGKRVRVPYATLDAALAYQQLVEYVVGWPCWVVEG